MNNSVELKKEPVNLENMSVGISENGFLVTFNTDSKNKKFSILIPTDKFAQVVSLMVYSGKQFEEHYGKMVFGGGDSNE